MHHCLGVLHREVGALDESNLHGPASVMVSILRPRRQSIERRVGLRQVRLQDDARVETLELRLVEHGRERTQGHFEVPILLHVQIDEHARVNRRSIQVAQACGDAIDRTVEVDRDQLRDDR